MQTALKELRNKAAEAKSMAGASVPSHAVARIGFRDRTAGDLMHCVIAWLLIHLHHFDRSDNHHKVGNTRKPISTMLDPEDTFNLLTSINGKCVFIMITDKPMSPVHLDTKKRAERGGAHFWVISSFEEFLTEYKQLTTK